MVIANTAITKMQSTLSRSAVQLATEIKETEAQSKFFNERISQIEANFAELCTEFIKYAQRTAKLRNNGDELAQTLLNYSVNEKINRTTARTLKKFAELLSTLEDYRHAEVDRLFAKVITPLSTYGEEVKRIRTNIKVETAARKKEVSQLKRIGREPQRGAEERINIVTRDALRSAEALENHVIQFEAKKLRGLKEILTDFVHIEMLWHAKALETLTNAFNVIQSLQEDVDLADFRSTLFRSGTSATLDNSNISQSRSVPALNTSSSSLRQENLKNCNRGEYEPDDDEYEGEESDSDDYEESVDEEEEEDSDNANDAEEDDEDDTENESEEEDATSEEESKEVEQSEITQGSRSGNLIDSTVTAKSEKPLKSALKHSQKIRAR
ncbi:hypothetical protein Aperf_G00000110124 [Anoplocephala perfoliata]